MVAKIPLGLAFEIPLGHALIVAMRSGIAFKTPLRQPNGIGVIDSDYRGEIAMLFDNTDPGDFDDDGNPLSAREVSTLSGEPVTWDVGREFPVGSYLIRKGDRVAQGFVIPLPAVTFTEVGELSETERGDGGFGSTGIVA
jgi:dUTP pyrophosphatase